MKKAKIIIAALMSAAVMGGVSANAADAPEGYVTFYADKSVLGQGLTVEPVQVPFYTEDTGITIVQRAADVLVTESDYGDYIGAFSDIDTGAQLPDAIAAVCPDMFGRSREGYLSEYDYTSEAGWNLFLNGGLAQVGISGYEPQDGDVIALRFTVYGYGSDLGVDNTSWGGAAPLTELTDASELARLAAENPDSAAYEQAVEVLGTFGASQSDIDAAEMLFTQSEDSGKQSPETGTEGIVAVIGAAALAGAALLISKKR